MKLPCSKISAIDYYLPETIVTNDDLKRENPSWDMDEIKNKAGVSFRHIAKPEETSLDLAVKACEKLFKDSIKKETIDAIIFCTQSPDYIMPPNSSLIHKHFELKTNVLTFDINLACSGYIYGLAIANSFIISKLARHVLLITAETYSKFIHPRDRSARVLFGDGAAATLVSASFEGQGFIDIQLSSSGKDFDKFYIPAGGLRIPKSAKTGQAVEDRLGNIRTSENIYMDGLGIWSFVNSVVPQQLNEILERNNLTLFDIDQFIFHQASRMTLDSILKKMNMNPLKAFTNLEDKGNTVSASIPIALKDAWDQGVIHRGDTLILCGFGVGLSYGTILLEF